MSVISKNKINKAPVVVLSLALVFVLLISSEAVMEQTFAAPVSPPAIEALPPPIDTGLPPVPDPASGVVTVAAPKNAKAAIAVDADTGLVYMSKNADKQMAVASISKLMTLWLLFERIDSGEISLDDKVTISSSKIQKMSMDYSCGGYKLAKGKKYSIRELVRLTAVKSSNAASIQLGICMAGSNRDFVALMNEEAARLGLIKSFFNSACGLGNKDLKRFGLSVGGKKNDANLMSAADVALLSSLIIKEHPGILLFTKKPSAKVKGKSFPSTNKLLGSGSLAKRAKDYGFDGLKTGYTKKAGNCLATTCMPQDKHRLIMVILSDPDKFDDALSKTKAIYSRNELLLAA